MICGPGRGPWCDVDQVELATLGWAHWWNTQRRHSYLGHLPPAEFEADPYACLAPAGTIETQ